MQQPLSADAVAYFFAAAPLVLGLIAVIVTFSAKGGETAATVPAGQTFACADCGRRGARDHMLPQNHEGAVSWHCAKCGGAAH